MKIRNIFHRGGIQDSKNREIITGFLFMAPFLILAAVFIFMVFINGVQISLRNARGVSFGDYIGFDNYMKLSSGWFYFSVLNTLRIVFVCLVTQVPAAFLLACWINYIPYKKIQALVQAAFFVPCLMAPLIIGFVFRMLFTKDPFTGGPDFMNWLLGLMHLPHNFEWMLDKRNEFFMVVFTSFWQSIGFESVFFVAYLQSISSELYEAARIDGASAVQIFFKIKIPLTRPALTYVIVTSVIASFLMNEMTIMLFPRGPKWGGVTMMNYIFYQIMYNHNLDLGLGAAAGIIAFLIILGVSLLQIPIFGIGKARGE
ncbi:MAG: sugar ABC transporter permease [Brevinematales bacterium]|jgi:ABC-type sugar transport system permease subunit